MSMKSNPVKRISLILIVIVLSMTFFSGCVDQHQKSDENTEGKYLVKGSTAPAKAPENPRIVATSAATCEIMERLDLDLIGRPTELTTPLPKRYMEDESITDVGSPMAPDTEIIKSIKPDYVIGPATLQPAFESKFQKADIPYVFINLKSVQGLYTTIEQLGYLFHREEQAKKQIQEYRDIMKEYRENHKERKKPKVLLLMGVPGAYIVATPNSYVGNLVELAGGENVYSDSNQEFMKANTEDMKQRKPDVILRCSHAMPQVVKDMFAEEFETNDIWRHFEAVKEGRVYDLTYEYFGMSANFNWRSALKELEPLLYPENGGEDL